MNNEEIIVRIIEGNLQTLFNLLEPIKEENQKLKEAYRKVKYGTKIKYHIEHNLSGHAEIRDRTQEVILNGTNHPIEEWWDEEEERRATARKALLEYYMEDDKRFGGR